MPDRRRSPAVHRIRSAFLAHSKQRRIELARETLEGKISKRLTSALNCSHDDLDRILMDGVEAVIEAIERAEARRDAFRP